MQNWFKIQAKAADRVEVQLLDEIGGWGISGADFIGQLKENFQ